MPLYFLIFFVILPDPFKQPPSKQFEEIRRSIFNDVKDVSYYISSILDFEDYQRVKKNFDHRIRYSNLFHY